MGDISTGSLQSKERRNRFPPSYRCIVDKQREWQSLITQEAKFLCACVCVRAAGGWCFVALKVVSSMRVEPLQAWVELMVAETASMRACVCVWVCVFFVKVY